jgi:GNAT superfamily N-acetyltransferase
VELITVHDGPWLEEVRRLFQEYAASLGIDLSFQNFAGELAALPGEYAPPGGTLLLALIDSAAAACVGIRRMDETRCEMKRLFVRPQFQRSGCGRELAERAIEWAGTAGYAEMLLDTLPTMAGAQRLYERLGFRDVAAYRFNPIAGTRFMARALTPERRPGDGGRASSPWSRSS